MGRQNIFDGFLKLFYNEILLTCSMSRTLTQQKGKEKEQREREKERERERERERESGGIFKEIFQERSIPVCYDKMLPTPDWPI